MTATCSICRHWALRDNREMARHRFARCGLGPAWMFWPPRHSCRRHAPLDQAAAETRLAWLGGEA